MRSLLPVLCGVLLHVGALHAQHGFWQPEERVLVTSFLHARSIATDQRYVYVATANGLEIYDQTFRRWLSPSTVEDGYPVLERPARIAYDPRERGLWLLTEAQTLYTWNDAIQRWQLRFLTELSDDIRALFEPRVDGADPALQIMRSVAGRDQAGRTWRVTDITPAERAGTFWVSTWGGNFSFVDTRNLSSEAQTFGTVSRGVSALALDSKGDLWFGGDGNGPRNGITRSDAALQRWSLFDGAVSDAPRTRVHAFSVSSLGLHAAADGTFAWRNNQWQRVATGDARALAYTTGKLWIAGRAELGWLDAADAYHRADFPVQPVHALAARNDTLWIGAQSGLYRWTQGALQQMAAGSQIRDVAISGNTLLAISASGVHTWETERLSLPLRNAALNRVGQALSLSAHGDRVWIGGSAGLAEWNTTNDSWRYLTIPDDIPEGPIYDVLPQGEYIWVATPAGALRLEWN